MSRGDDLVRDPARALGWVLRHFFEHTLASLSGVGTLSDGIRNARTNRLLMLWDMEPLNLEHARLNMGINVDHLVNVIRWVTCPDLCLVEQASAAHADMLRFVDFFTERYGQKAHP